MLDIKNTTLQNINQNKKLNANFVRMKNMMDTKMASYLRYLGTKNAVNRASDYHYLCLAVSDSTAPVNGIDYIHPVVKPCVDYVSAVIVKGLAPNGEINFDFVPDTEEDDVFLSVFHFDSGHLAFEDPQEALFYELKWS